MQVRPLPRLHFQTSNILKEMYIFSPISETGKIPDGMPDSRVLAHALNDWGNCSAGATPPKNFGFGMVYVSKRLGGATGEYLLKCANAYHAPKIPVTEQLPAVAHPSKVNEVEVAFKRSEWVAIETKEHGVMFGVFYHSNQTWWTGSPLQSPPSEVIGFSPIV